MNLSTEILETMAIGFSVFALLVFCIAAYWHIREIRRILVVSRNQHPIPENVFWLKRARQALNADLQCQYLRRKANLWSIVFIVALIPVGLTIALIFGVSE